jgi:predicted amidophosphoribosyltransferase
MMLTKIDDLIRPDHGYLTSNDQCYFLGEYTARKGYSQSKTNQLVLNFKKGVDKQGKPEWKYKQQAIETVSSMFYQTLDPELLMTATLVPIPPSKAKSDPMYDDRLLQMLQGIDITNRLDIRELIIQTQSTKAAHELENRPRPEEIERLYTIDTNLVQPIPSEIWIFDDVLTAGTHYRAASNILMRTFPGVPISGYFIARRVPEDSA